MAMSKEILPRTGAALCPDWSVTAALADAGHAPGAAAATLRARRIVATTLAARQEGVLLGMRQRDAQATCPDLVLLEPNPDRDARLFEPVSAAVADLVAGVQVLRPGLCVFAAAGPVRYFGSEARLAERLIDHVAGAGQELLVGFAEGVFAAELAAGRSALVPVGATAEFLAELDVAVLGRPELVSVLRRCGITTLGAVKALGHRAVTSRFGAEGVVAYRLAAGLQDAPIVAREPEEAIEASMRLDPPAERIQYATAAVHTVAEQFNSMLVRRGAVCTVLRIDAATATGQVRSRTWRAESVFSFDEIAVRLRWQLEAWLTTGVRLSSGITELALAADQIAPAGGMQLGLWGATGAGQSRADLAIDRVQAQLGVAAVTTAALAGARLPRDQTVHTPWRDQQRKDNAATLPWPDQIPAPIATLPIPIKVELQDREGHAVQVSDRHLISDPPITLNRPHRTIELVTGWAGPWPLQECWWYANTRHGAWLQLTVAVAPEIESALLLFFDRRSWWLVGSYD